MLVLLKNIGQNVNVDDEIRNIIQEIAKENSCYTLTQINQLLRELLPRKPHIEKNASSNAINERCIR